MTDVLETTSGRRIAYNRTSGSGPGVVFLGGFRSDMTGTKALHLQDWAERSGRAFLRFDYSGHGESSGAFADGAIGDWAEDAAAALDRLTEGPQVLVGSSMGGWIALLLAQRSPERVAGLVGVAAAPDFTEEMWEDLGEDERRQVAEQGHLTRPSDYGDEPELYTRRLFEDGRAHLVLRRSLSLPFPVRLLLGTADADVDVGWTLRLLDHAEAEDLHLTLVKGADHRFSTPACLGLIVDAIEGVGAG